MTGSIALVTCAQLAEGEDAQVLGPALSALGVRSCWQVWDDPAVDWAAFDLAVLRSTWDYPGNRRRFVAWAESVPRRANAVGVVAWNSDKRYLRDVAAAGVPVVPSEWSDPGESVDLPVGEFVVKPSVGAGSGGVGRFGPGAHAAARSHVAALHDAGRAVMVQPYLADVDTAGETALIYLDGAFSHAVRKAAMLSEATVHDMAPGGPVVLELELIEPSLFFQYDQDAAARFAAAAGRRL